MDKWGALQRQDVVPDKISRQLLKDSVGRHGRQKQRDQTHASLHGMKVTSQPLELIGCGVF